MDFTAAKRHTALRLLVMVQGIYAVVCVTSNIIILVLLNNLF